MPINCEAVATEELKRLHDIQMLLEVIVLAVTNQAYFARLGFELPIPLPLPTT